MFAEKLIRKSIIKLIIAERAICSPDKTKGICITGTRCYENVCRRPSEIPSKY